MDATLWPVSWPHDAPEGVMSPEEAHRTMLRHNDCDTATCPRKAAAFDVFTAPERVRSSS
jgi:hypothetical protein